MRRELTREALDELMRELARAAPAGESFRVCLVGGGTAVLAVVEEIPDAAYARYPSPSRAAVEDAVDDFLSGLG